MSRTPSPSRQHSRSTPPESRETPPYSHIASPESPAPSTPTTTVPVPNTPPRRPRRQQRQQAPASYLIENAAEQFLEESEEFELNTNASNFDNLALALEASGLMEEKQKEIHEERMKTLQSLVKTLEGDEWMFFGREKLMLPF